MVCAGFLSFENLPVQETNAMAEEGTAFGELVQHMLLNPDRESPKQASNGVYFDDEMRFYARPAVNEVLGDKESEVLCEQRIDWKTRSGIWIRGSYDRSFVRKGRLYIDDDKYGWGIVEVKDNWQLLGYAIGEVIRRGVAFDEIVLRVHQPRPHHEDGTTREWVLTYAELLMYKEKIEARMEMIAGGDKTLQTSSKCKYCAAAGEACPAFNRLYYRGLEVAYGFTQDHIDDAELARQLDQVARAEEVLKIKKDSINELAVQRIKNGQILPGWITESRYGDRKWKAGIDPDTIKALTGFDVIDKVMLSPAKVEKLGVDKKFVNALVDRHFIGQKLVRKDSSKVSNDIFGNQQPKGVQ
jgi:hypothetical protein